MFTPKTVRKVVGIIGVVGLFAAAGSASALTGKHDLSAAGYGSTEKCMFCHTPHDAPGVNGPLWNHDNSTITTYNMYDSTFSSTIDMTVAAAPGPVSLACLSCHDGTIGIDQYAGNNTGSTKLMPTVNQVGTVLATNNDLRTQHPIAVTYDDTIDTAFNPAVDGKVGTAVLFANKVECASCHNPHDNTAAPYLRSTNAASALCTQCHIK